MYVILSYYSDGSGIPQLTFETDSMKAISIIGYERDEGKQVEVYKIYGEDDVDKIIFNEPGATEYREGAMAGREATND